MSSTSPTRASPKQRPISASTKKRDAPTVTTMEFPSSSAPTEPSAPRDSNEATMMHAIANVQLMHAAGLQPHVDHISGSHHVVVPTAVSSDGKRHSSALLASPHPRLVYETSAAGGGGNGNGATSTPSSSHTVRLIPNARRWVGRRCSFVMGRDTWFDGTDEVCMHDLLPIDSAPVPIVEEWDPNTNVCIVYGTFYSLSNVKAYLRERNDPLAAIKMLNTTRFVLQVMNGDVSQQAPAPASTWLDTHGGPLSARQARSMFGTALVLDQPHVKFVPAPLLAEVQVSATQVPFELSLVLPAGTRSGTMHQERIRSRMASHHLKHVARADADRDDFEEREGGHVTMAPTIAVNASAADEMMDVDGASFTRGDDSASERPTVSIGTLDHLHVTDARLPVSSGTLTANFLNNAEVANSWQVRLAANGNASNDGKAYRARDPLGGRKIRAHSRSQSGEP